MNDPRRFEDDFPQVAQFLMEVYRESPRFSCPKGHLHHLPYHLHCGKDYCKKTEHKDYCR